MSPTDVTPTSADGVGAAGTNGPGSGTPAPGTPAAGDLTWTTERAAGGDPVVAIAGASASDIWAVGGKSILHSTGDGTWQTVATNADDSYLAVYAADGWVFVGGTSCSGGLCQGGVLLRSSDGGATWSRQAIGAGVSGFSAAGGTLYVDSSDVFASRDHFATSEKVPLVWATSVGVYATDGALFAYGGLRGSAIRRSTDGGQTWATVYEGFSGSKSGHMDALVRGDKALFAIANGCSVPACVGAVLRSDDGGANWRLGPQIADWARGLWANGDGEVWLGGARMMRSTDGGATFATVALPTATTIEALWGPGVDELYAAGTDGSILHGKR